MEYVEETDVCRETPPTKMEKFEMKKMTLSGKLSVLNKDSISIDFVAYGS